MENYKLKNRLGKGAQGSVYLAENKVDSKTYVLKKVECTDESEATKAFKEAMALNGLQHPYVCGYKEFFVTWDKEESAMFVCIVMELYKNGDLDKALSMKRSKKASIDEVVIKKWMGQVIEALISVHSKGVIHRDLKPSNIFVKEDLGLAIGDFGVATLMGDARTKTRTTVGSMNWMAPEVLERPYDERIDVWSAGCIFLEMVTCGIYDKQEIQSKLFELKTGPPQVLEDILKEVKSQGYSDKLIAVIRTMLRKNFKQRPTSSELKELPYVKECLQIAGVDHEDKKAQQANSSGVPAIPKGEGVDKLLAHLKRYKTDLKTAQDCLQELARLTREEGNAIGNQGKNEVAEAIKENIADETTVLAGFDVLKNLIVNSQESDALISSPLMIITICVVLTTHPNNKKVQLAGISLLNALSVDEEAQEIIGKNKGLSVILDSMRQFNDDLDIVSACCDAIWGLTVNEDNAKSLTDDSVLDDVCKAMQTFPKEAKLNKAAAAALLSLSMEDENLDRSNDLNCVGLLINALKIHIKDSEVVKNCCMALSSLVEPDEECAFKVLSNDFNDEKVAGLPVIIDAYKQHKDNAEVVEHICTLLMELVEYDDVCDELKSLNVEAILKEVQKKFLKNQDILAPCEATIAKLGGGKVTQRPTSARNRKK